MLPGRTATGTEIVLKVGVPCRELLTEAAALGLYDGRGAVRLLDHDAPRGMLLLARVTPGEMLYELQCDPAATRTAATLMRQLWRTPPAEHAFPSLAVWFKAFERFRQQYGAGNGPFPPGLTARAERTFIELNESSGQSVLLHGDLHHGNILFAAAGGWMAIDPKGLCGDPGYEMGTFMLNQLPVGAADAETLAVLAQRLMTFAAELQMERTRLARWAFCHAVLSALWSLEEADDWQPTIRLAQMLESLT